MNKISLPTLGIAVSIMVYASVSVAGGSIGNLIAQGKVNVQSATTNITANIEDTNYSYFDSDQLSTRDMAKAIIELENGKGYVLVEGNSSANLDKNVETYTVNIEQGSVVFSFKSGTDFYILANGKVIKPTLSQDYQLIDTQSGTWASGKITVGSNNDEVEFQAVTGDYVFSDTLTNEVKQVVSGETLIHQSNLKPVVLKTQAGGDNSNADNALPLIIFLAAAGITALSDDSSSDGDTPVVPATPATPATPTTPATTTGGGGSGGGVPSRPTTPPVPPSAS